MAGVVLYQEEKRRWGEGAAPGQESGGSGLRSASRPESSTQRHGAPGRTGAALMTCHRPQRRQMPPANAATSVSSSPL